MASLIEPPYGVIFDSLLRGYVVPVLGAGASLVGRPRADWNGRNPAFLPTGSELSRFLADTCEYPSAEVRKREELAKVSSYYQDVGSRRLLRQCLRDVFLKDYPQNCLHEFLLSINRPLVIVVTNYDTLLEDAFRAAGRPFDLVVYPADDRSNKNGTLWWPSNAAEPQIVHPNQLLIDLDTTTVIYKMHGTVLKDSNRWDNFVITEEDYLDFMSRMINKTAVPKIFSEHFRMRSFLFLGYSLQDWNMRVILRHLGRPQPGAKRSRDDDEDEGLLPSWAIQLKVEDDDERLWKTRNINLYQVDLQVFVDKMRQRIQG
jgi:hypothetical protein